MWGIVNQARSPIQAQRKSDLSVSFNSNFNTEENIFLKKELVDNVKEEQASPRQQVNATRPSGPSKFELLVKSSPLANTSAENYRKTFLA